MTLSISWQILNIRKITTYQSVTFLTNKSFGGYVNRGWNKNKFSRATWAFMSNLWGPSQFFQGPDLGPWSLELGLSPGKLDPAWKFGPTGKHVPIPKIIIKWDTCMFQTHWTKFQTDGICNQCSTMMTTTDGTQSRITVLWKSTGPMGPSTSVNLVGPYPILWTIGGRACLISNVCINVINKQNTLFC